MANNVYLIHFYIVQMYTVCYATSRLKSSRPKSSGHANFLNDIRQRETNVTLMQGQMNMYYLYTYMN